MKQEIHPKYFDKAKVKCVCGNTFETGSTKPELNVEICFNCHPFYTGKQNLIDTAGKVEKFKARRAKAEASASKRTVKKPRVKKIGKTKK